MKSPTIPAERAEREVRSQAERAAGSPWAERLARFGLAAKGVSYGIVAVLALKVAIGGDGKVEDRAGALQQVAKDTSGRILLAVLGVGLAAYALWRVAVAILGHELESSEKENVLKRLGYLGRGVLYAALAYIAFSLVLNARSGSGGGSREEDRATARVLELPGGRWIVALGGVAVIGAGAFNAYRAVSAKFRDDLKTREMSAAEDRWATRIGVFGHAARAAVFALIGAFLVRAAVQYDPNEAIGLDGALLKIAQQDYGMVLLAAVAVGLLAYGVFCLVQARYRRV